MNAFVVDALLPPLVFLAQHLFLTYPEKFNDTCAENLQIKRK